MNKKLVLSVLSTAVVASMTSAAMAAPKAGFYVGGDSNKYYSLTYFLQHTGTVLSDILKHTNETVYVSSDAKAGLFMDVIDTTTSEEMNKKMHTATKADFSAKPYTIVGGTGSYDATTDPDLTGAVPGDLKVDSVSAINASQIVVKFGKEVAEGTGTYGAENPANYKLTNATLTGVELDDEGTSAILTITPIKTKTSVAVTVQPIADAKDATKKTALYSTTVTVDDTTPPTVTDIVSKTNGATASSVTINFSEPIQVGATFKIDGAKVTATPVYSNGNQTVTFNNQSLDATKSHTLEIIGLLDTADNVSNPNPLTKTFNVSVDATLPAVSTVEAYGDKAILVTFSKKVDATTVNGTNVKVKDELLQDIATSAITAQPGGTQFVVTIDPSVALYSATKTSRNLTVLVTEGVKDTLGNKLATTTKSVTLNKDVTAPVVSGVSFQNDADGKLSSLTVEFNKALKAGTYTLSTSNLSVIDKDGVDVTSTFTSYFGSATVSAGGKKLEFNKAAGAPATKFYNQYTFQFKKGLVKDASEAGNDSAAFTKVIDFGAQPNGTFVLDNTATPKPAIVSGNEITVNFGRVVKGGSVAGSATDGNNYTLNGVALTNATITLTTDKKSAKIVLPAGSIATTDAAAVFRITNVQDANGVTITPYVQTVGVTDNTAPILQSARVLDNKTIELTFNEAMSSLSTDSVGDEFTIFEGTTAKALDAADLKASSVSGFKNKITVAISKGTDTTGTPAVVSAVTKSNATGATVGVFGTYTGTTNKTFVVKVVTVDSANPANVATWAISSDNGAHWSVAGTTTDLGDGLTLGAFTAGTADAAVDDTFTFTATAAVAPTSAVTLDLSKDISIKTIGKDTGFKVKDLAGNDQQDGVTVPVQR